MGFILSGVFMKMVRNGQLDDLNTLQKRHLMIRFYFMARWFTRKSRLWSSSRIYASFHSQIIGIKTILENESIMECSSKWKRFFEFMKIDEFEKKLFFGTKIQLELDSFPKIVDTIFKWIHYPEWNFDPIFTVFWRCFEWNSTNNSWIGSWVQWIILYQKGNLFLRGSFYHLYQFKHDCIFLDCLDLYIQIRSYRTRVGIVSNRKCSCTRTQICSSWNIMICGKSLKSINLN